MDPSPSLRVISLHSYPLETDKFVSSMVPDRPLCLTPNERCEVAGGSGHVEFETLGSSSGPTMSGLYDLRGPALPP